VVAYAVTHYTQAAFEKWMRKHRSPGCPIQEGVRPARGGNRPSGKKHAEANFTERMAIDLSRSNADQSLYVRDAVGSAQEHGLDYVEFVNHDGVLIFVGAVSRSCRP